MTAAQIDDLLAGRRYPGAKEPATLVETHISWVILTPDFAFKIKKPVRFDFLDVSTVERRRFFCGEEVRLNRRLAPAMYLDVVPVGTEDGRPAIGSLSAPVVDYAVRMRRMDETQQMDRLLDAGRVTPAQLDALAAQLAAFHREGAIDRPEAYVAGEYRQDFEDLYRQEEAAVRWLGPEAADRFRQWKETLPAFLATHAIRLRARYEQGFWVDGHGDLHARNIFLAGEPVVFDCIEFNPHFRRLDVLNELAFLCMDLEARGHDALSRHFMEAYRQRWEVMPAPEDRLLFEFFKAYRANVRLKVGLLELRDHQPPGLAGIVQRYWSVLKNHRFTSKPLFL
jgi:aminoglycoside phosphotransferase family enzyme